MKLLDKILVPIDFSDSTEVLIDNVLQIAKSYNSEVILLAVLPEDAKVKSVESIIKERALSKINQLNLKLSSNGVRINDPILVYGEPVENVLKNSRIKDVNVIYLSSNYFTKKKKEDLSVYTEKIIRRAEKPVWVYKQKTAQDISKIICPIDVSSASERALKNAILLSRKLKAELIVLSVFSPINSLSIWRDADLNDENQKRKKDYNKKIETFLEKFSFQDLNYQKVIVDGEPDEEILNYIHDNKIDLLIIGTTGKNSIGKALIGSVTQEVVRNVGCSFITTKSADIIKIKLENEIHDIETHTKIAEKLLESGLFEEAISQYEICLRINSMHIPSHYSIAKVFKKQGKKDKAQHYEKLASELMNRLWDRKIEHEIRRHYSK